jgi:Trk-type K+ transport system membrane component
MKPPRTLLRLSNLSRADALRSRETRLRAERATRLILLPLAALAAASLIAEYGFYLTPARERLWRGINVAVLYGFVIQQALRLLVVPDRLRYLASRWLESGVALLIALHVLFPRPIADFLHALFPSLEPEDVARGYLLVTQGFLVVAFLPGMLRTSKRLLAASFQPSTLLLLTFVFLILVGTAFLMLPRAVSTGSISPVDALFTATSAVCVTGLTVVDTASAFTRLGHSIILVLIQVGGLGIMTLTTFFAYAFGTQTRLKEYTTLQSILGEDSLGEIRTTIIRITTFTFLVEGIGALAVYAVLVRGVLADRTDALFFSVFHAVSAFCNAGFALTTHSLADPGLRWETGFLLVIMVLVTLGGIGYPVVSNLTDFFLRRPQAVAARRLTPHTKLVLITSLILVLTGAVAFALLPGPRVSTGTAGTMPLQDAVFLSVSARTAGFATLDLSMLSAAGLFVLVMLMWIGASPGSTGGGIKTTTLALSVLTIKSLISGSARVEVFRRRVTDTSVSRAFSTIVLSVFYVGAALFLLLMFEQQPMDRLLFEVVSALSTVGFSTGITASLGVPAKLVLVVTMLFGRVGLLAVVLALVRRTSAPPHDYTEANILIS